MSSIIMRDQKNVCPDCGDKMQFGSGCYFCPSCGFGRCGKIKGLTRGSVVMLLGFFCVYGVVGYLEQEPVPGNPPVAAVQKSRTQEQIERILPPAVAAPIAERSAYPRTLAAIAHKESRGNHKAIGDRGQSRGAFQIQEKHWADKFGPVPDSIEMQVDQANALFLALVKSYGYREAVKRWNGSGPSAAKYQRDVIALVKELEQ